MGRRHQRHVPVDNSWRRDSGLPFTLTEHAIAQFHARIAPGLTWGACSREVQVLARTAIRTDQRTGPGDEIWIATDGAPVRFVCRLDRGRRVCTTVLEPAASGEEVAGD